MNPKPPIFVLAPAGRVTRTCAPHELVVVEAYTAALKKINKILR